MRATLQGCKEALGPKHSSMLNTANNLGVLYEKQGRLAETEVMYIRALQGYEDTLGPKHTSALDTASNLRQLHTKQGRTVK